MGIDPRGTVMATTPQHVCRSTCSAMHPGKVCPQALSSRTKRVLRASRTTWTNKGETLLSIPLSRVALCVCGCPPCGRNVILIATSHIHTLSHPGGGRRCENSSSTFDGGGERPTPLTVRLTSYQPLFRRTSLVASRSNGSGEGRSAAAIGYRDRGTVNWCIGHHDRFVTVDLLFCRAEFSSHFSPSLVCSACLNPSVRLSNRSRPTNCELGWGS